MAEIDQIALNMARQSTQDDEPQRRAQLQVAVVEALRPGQASLALVDLLGVRNQLHVMATTVVPNFCDLAAGLQTDVQALIEDHRGTSPEERS